MTKSRGFCICAGRGTNPDSVQQDSKSADIPKQCFATAWASTQLEGSGQWGYWKKESIAPCSETSSTVHFVRGVLWAGWMAEQKNAGSYKCLVCTRASIIALCPEPTHLAALGSFNGKGQWRHAALSKALQPLSKVIWAATWEYDVALMSITQRDMRIWHLTPASISIWLDNDFFSLEGKEIFPNHVSGLRASLNRTSWSEILKLGMYEI